MTFRTILLTPRFDPSFARLWQNALPTEIRIEADPSGPGHLDAELLHPRTKRVGVTVAMARWTLEHDLRNGRIFRMTFPADRSGPKPPYEELFEALTTVNLAYAAAEHGSEPYRFGLAMTSKLLLGWLHEDEAILRPLLTPPFPDTPC
jgi:hypothetical protein